ncbi:MAG: ADP-ribosylglycohydrolase family protein [Alphaproteobacteria bacterium]|nr:ADP-ribosylglycohydrolase family protein [Alphaproteobacteria bacterium]
MPSPSFADRSLGAFWGLALGDAYGRTLEFVTGSAVRTRPVSVAPGDFMWTDDTHMSLYLALAILDQPPGRLEREAFGNAVGRRYVEWMRDPLTPSTAPGGTCLRGAAAFARHGDWGRSGDRGSDGSGAVMRVCPLPIALQGEDLSRGAYVSSVVTHAHPNAIEAAMAAAHMLREALETGVFDAGVVGRAVEGLRGPWSRGGFVADALEAAVGWARQRTGDWLDEPAIPDGGGGWRSASALGLGVAAALRWGEDFATAVEKAARIQGDSDSVACLTGMFLGGAGGVAVLPPAWVGALPQADHIRQMTARLVSWSKLLPPAPAS